MAETAQRKQKRGPKYCCVVGCHNSADNSRERDPPVKLFRFPGRWYEKERRQSWITAVRRVNPDGTLWQPKEHTRICSRHFVGNSKSDVSQDPSYIPTIFPPVYRKKAPDQERAQRHAKQRNVLLQGSWLYFSKQQMALKHLLKSHTQK
ncbi:THAP domain-containing protein 11-like [Amblyomma americanum]